MGKPHLLWRDVVTGLEQYLGEGTTKVVIRIAAFVPHQAKKFWLESQVRQWKDRLLAEGIEVEYAGVHGSDVVLGGEFHPMRRPRPDDPETRGEIFLEILVSGEIIAGQLRQEVHKAIVESVQKLLAKEVLKHCPLGFDPLDPWQNAGSLDTLVIRVQDGEADHSWVTAEILADIMDLLTQRHADLFPAESKHPSVVYAARIRWNCAISDQARHELEALIKTLFQASTAQELMVEFLNW